MPATEPVTLPVHCAACGGAQTLQIAEWPSQWTPDPPQNTIQTWDCPYCQVENNGGFPGRLAWVTPGHAQSEERH